MSDEGETPERAGGTAPREITIRIGRKVPDQDSQRYVARSGFAFASTVWESSVNALLEREPRDLLDGEVEIAD